MTIKIIKYSKTDFSLVEEIKTSLSKSTGMTISHYADSDKASGVTLDFEFEGMAKHVPHINDIEFCTVVRKKIDMTGVGVNGKIIKDVGNDIGKYNYKDVAPKRLSDLPPGFQELYKG